MIKPARRIVDIGHQYGHFPDEFREWYRKVNPSTREIKNLPLSIRESLEPGIPVRTGMVVIRPSSNVLNLGTNKGIDYDHWDRNMVFQYFS